MAEQKEQKPVKNQEKEKLYAVIVETGFTDGNLSEAFGKYGYPCEWPAGEARELPKWLIDRVIQSGGVVTPK